MRRRTARAEGQRTRKRERQAKVCLLRANDEKCGRVALAVRNKRTPAAAIRRPRKYFQLNYPRPLLNGPFHFENTHRERTQGVLIKKIESLSSRYPVYIDQKFWYTFIAFVFYVCVNLIVCCILIVAYFLAK